MLARTHNIGKQFLPLQASAPATLVLIIFKSLYVLPAFGIITILVQNILFDVEPLRGSVFLFAILPWVSPTAINILPLWGKQIFIF